MNEYEAHKLVDGVKTLAEHESIILHYRKTGQLDREHAIQVYREFSVKNPGYIAAVRAQAAVRHDGVDVSMASDDVIVGNLNQQIMYCGGKNLLGGLCNGK